jgi:homoserine O-acetyltransferase/O-succinyltransferase
MNVTLRAAARLAVALAVGLAAAAAQPYDGIVKKEVFTLPSYTTVGGKTIKNVRIGYETYGRLNAAKDNVIVVSHFFTGTSHAAGKYTPEDKAPGYWDSIIGAGRPIDTDRFFVIATDTLVNLNTKDKNVTTTGPATVNPDTGKPWGLAFPVVSFTDFIHVQKALLDSLGIRKIYAAVGASGGAIQSVEWAAAYPEMVDRVIAAVGPGLEIDAYTIGMLNVWALPISMDPKWNNGDYYGKEEPLEGVAQGLKIITLSGSGRSGLDNRFGRKWASDGENPLQGKAYAIEEQFYKTGHARAATVDANHYLYTVKANQLFSVMDRVKSIRAKFLFIPARSDLIFPPALAEKAAATLRAQGNQVELFVIEGDGGHYDGVFQIMKADKAIRDFLAR